MLRNLVVSWRWVGAVVALMLIGSLTVTGVEPDTKVYELRTYYAADGKLDALLTRFRDHTTKLFAKYGMTNVGYWVPSQNPDRKLIYLLSYPDQAARKKSWAAFLADPDWKAAQQASEANGKILDKIESQTLVATDYSPAIDIKNLGNRVFELRTYTATPGNLDRLHARFRDHTIKLFATHGMTNIGYWALEKGQPNSDVTLIYLLSHASRDAAKESFAAFGKDPAWQTARKDSETGAGGPLTIKGGVQSLFLEPTDFSPLR